MSPMKSIIRPANGYSLIVDVFEMPGLLKCQREFRGGFQCQAEIFRHVLEENCALQSCWRNLGPLRSETPECATLGTNAPGNRCRPGSQPSGTMRDFRTGSAAIPAMLRFMASFSVEAEPSGPMCADGRSRWVREWGAPFRLSQGSRPNNK